MASYYSTTYSVKKLLLFKVRSYALITQKLPPKATVSRTSRICRCPHTDLLGGAVLEESGRSKVSRGVKKSSQVVGLRDRVAIIRGQNCFMQFPHHSLTRATEI